MSAPESIGESLRALSVASFLFQTRVAADLGLHPTDLQALHHLGRAGSLTAGDLARALRLTTGSTTAVIDRLVRLGYAGRAPDPSDRRTVVVSLSEDRRKALRAPYRRVDRRVRRLLARRSARELTVIAAFLAELVNRS
jgi:DNA-binding MarR family transcriptional regulator